MSGLSSCCSYKLLSLFYLQNKNKHIFSDVMVKGSLAIPFLIQFQFIFSLLPVRTLASEVVTSCLTCPEVSLQLNGSFSFKFITKLVLSEWRCMFSNCCKYLKCTQSTFKSTELRVCVRMCVATPTRRERWWRRTGRTCL